LSDVIEISCFCVGCFLLPLYLAGIRYGISRKFEEPVNILIYDMGAGSLEVSLMNFSSVKNKQNRTVGKPTFVLLKLLLCCCFVCLFFFWQFCCFFCHLLQMLYCKLKSLSTDSCN